MIYRLNKNFTKKQKPFAQVIHTISEFIFYENEWIPCYDFLERIGLAYHYIVMPDGELMQTLDVGIMGAHAKGFNKNTVGIVIAMQGRSLYGEFLRKLHTKYWSLDQISTLKTLSRSLHSNGISTIMRHDWVDKIIDRKGGNKEDPGELFPYNSLLQSVYAL